jgi:hypothetical protein
MAASSYINVGVLGNIAGTLGTAGLSAGAQFQQFAEGVKRRKRKVSGISQEEKSSVAARTAERLSASKENVGVEVDTSDVRPSDPAKGITKSPGVKPAPAPREQTLHPGRDFSSADAAFVKGLVDLQSRVGSKVGTGRVKGAASSISGDYDRLTSLAKATGNEKYIGYTNQLSSSLYAGQSSISAGNIGTAAASLNKAVGDVRNSLDLDYLLSSYKPAGPGPGVVGNTAKKVLRTFGGNF